MFIDIIFIIGFVVYFIYETLVNENRKIALEAINSKLNLLDEQVILLSAKLKVKEIEKNNTRWDC